MKIEEKTHIDEGFDGVGLPGREPLFVSPLYALVMLPFVGVAVLLLALAIGVRAVIDVVTNRDE